MRNMIKNEIIQFVIYIINVLVFVRRTTFS